MKDSIYDIRNKSATWKRGDSKTVNQM